MTELGERCRLALLSLRETVDEQAEDWDLWRIVENRDVMALQRALRKLHDEIEKNTPAAGGKG